MRRRSHRCRVVMITPDTQIDRRILLEAATLLEDGYDVYVLAEPSAGWPEFGYEHDVPIERISPRPTPLSRVVSTRVDRAAARLDRIALAGPYGVRGAAWRLRGALAIGRRLAGAGEGRLRLRRSGWSAWELAHIARVVAYRPDVVHCHDLPMLAIAAESARRARAQLVYDMHEFYPEQRTLSDRQRAELRRIEAKHIGDADALITVNPMLAAEISRAHGAVHIDVVENAIDPPKDLHGAPRDLLREELGLDDHAPIFLFQGWMSEDRNLRNLVEGALNATRDLHLVLMGYGEHGTELLARATQHPRSSRIHLVDAKPQEELMYFTASADVGVIPYEGADVNTRFCSPNKLYEFIAARVPVLANELAFVKTVVEGNGFGVVRSLSTPVAVAKALDSFPIEQLADFRARLAESSGAFTWSRQGRRLLDVYSELRSRARVADAA